MNEAPTKKETLSILGWGLIFLAMVFSPSIGSGYLAELVDKVIVAASLFMFFRSVVGHSRRVELEKMLSYIRITDDFIDKLQKVLAVSEKEMILLNEKCQVLAHLVEENQGIEVIYPQKKPGLPS